MTDDSRRNFLVRVGTLGLSAAGLAGCSSGDEGGFGDKPAARRTRPAAKKHKGRLVIGTIQNPPDSAKAALTKAYRARQPDVEIVWETKEFGEADAYTNWLGTQLAAGSIRPDIVSGNYVPSYRNYVNFDEYRDTTNPYTGRAWSKDLDFTRGRELNAWAERYMLATQDVHNNWFYNKALFAKADVEPPTTWSEFVAVAAALKAKGIIPLSANYQWQVPQWLSETYFDQYHVDWVETIRARKGDWNYDPKVDGKYAYKPQDPDLHKVYTYNPQRFYQGIADRKLRFDTPEMADLVANFAKMFPRYATKDFYVMTDQYTPFLQQRAAIMLAGSSELTMLEQDLEALSPARLKELGIRAGSVEPFEWGVFEYPAMEGPHVKSKPRSIDGSAGEYIAVIDKNAEQREMALDFCMFWLSEKGYQPYVDAWVKQGGYTASGPVRIDGVDLPSEFDARFSKVKMRGNPILPYSQFWTVGTDQQSRADLRNLLKTALDGRLSPKAYADRLQKYVDDNLDRMLKANSLTRNDIRNPARRPESA